MSQAAVDFKKITLPNKQITHVPSDISVVLPTLNEVPIEKLPALAFIPWHEAYLSLIPTRYQSFFEYVLPHLDARTSNVHTALSVSILERLIAGTSQPVDEDLLYVTVILHDTGWEQLDPEEIADSLSYASLTQSAAAMKPKEMHATLGSITARRLLRSYDGDLRLTKKQQTLVHEMVHYHDIVRTWPGKAPIEYQLLRDADQYWSFTHENFWLDTVRKQAHPSQYVKNLGPGIDQYFLTEAGRQLAHESLAERAREVAAYEEFVGQL